LKLNGLHGVISQKMVLFIAKTALDSGFSEEERFRKEILDD
jgi:hypothetical protein